VRGVAVLLLDHVPKEGNTARGSGRKLDYVDAMWELSDRTTLDALRSLGSSGALDKEWREEAMARGLGRTTYYRSRGTLVELGYVEKVMDRFFLKSPAKPMSHEVPPESHGTHGTTAFGGESHRSHPLGWWDHGTNQAGTSEEWGEV
jgi:hypothetical protein